jgi:hypothetical protein
VLSFAAIHRTCLCSHHTVRIEPVYGAHYFQFASPACWAGDLTVGGTFGLAIHMVEKLIHDWSPGFSVLRRKARKLLC